MANVTNFSTHKYLNVQNSLKQISTRTIREWKTLCHFTVLHICELKAITTSKDRARFDGSEADTT